MCMLCRHVCCHVVNSMVLETHVPAHGHSLMVRTPCVAAIPMPRAMRQAKASLLLAQKEHQQQVLSRLSQAGVGGNGSQTDLQAGHAGSQGNHTSSKVYPETSNLSVGSMAHVVHSPTSHHFQRHSVMGAPDANTEKVSVGCWLVIHATGRILAVKALGASYLCNALPMIATWVVQNS